MIDDARRRAENERLFAAAREVDRIAHHEVHHLEAMAGVINRYAADAVAAARREERERRNWLCKTSGYAGTLMLRVFEQDDAALRAGGPTEGTNDAIMCTAPGKKVGSICVLLEGHAGPHKFLTFRPLTEEGGG